MHDVEVYLIFIILKRYHTKSQGWIHILNNYQKEGADTH